MHSLPKLEPRNGLRVLYASVRALFLRELQTRFGQYRLGYFWIILEPALHIGFMLLIFGTIRERLIPGMSFEVFLLNGIVPFFMFQKTASQALNAIQANKGLFSYKPVKPIDTVIARSFLELFLHFTAYIFFVVVLLWFAYPMSFEAVPQLLGMWVLLFLLSFSIALIFLVIGDISDEFNKVISITFFILYLLSGILFTIHMVPVEYQAYLLWNPLLHVFELMRHFVAPTYRLADGISLQYVLEWILGSMFVGLLLYKRFEQRMLRSK